MRKHLKQNWFYYLGGILIFSILLFESRGEGDFFIFISASKDLLEGKNIYATLYNEWFHYYYDVPFALMLVPFTFLPLFITKLIWLILNVFFLYRIWSILKSWLPLSTLNRKQKNWFIILSFIFVLSFLRDNFHFAQMTIFILYLGLEGLYLIGQNKKVAGSFLIALGIDIKLLPIVLIVYLIYRNEWKAAFLTVGFIIVLLFLPAIFIGYEYNNFLLAERWAIINPTNQEHVLDTAERSFHSLTSLLATLFVEDCGDAQHVLPLKRNIADISIDKLNIIINVARGVLVLLTLFVLRSMPFKSASSKIQKLYELSYIFLIIPLIFPHQQHYAFFFIFPASTYLLFYLIDVFFTKRNTNLARSKWKKIALISIMGIAYFLTNSRFILGAFREYYDHYKTLTYGVLILLVLLLLCRPNQLSKAEQSVE